MDLKWVEDFLSLCRTGNFRESATERYVSQPAFSRRIQSLENWVGAELFDRSEIPIKLTPAGVAFRPTAEEMLALARQGRSDVRPGSAAANKSLTINVLHSLSVSFVPGWLMAMEDALGTLNAKVKVTQRGLRSFWKLLEDGSTDLAISYDDGGDAASLDPRRFRSLVIGRERLVPVAANGIGFDRWADFLEQANPPIPYLSYPAVSRLGRLVDTWLTQRGHEPNFRIVYEAPMPEQLLPMVVNGRGVAWLPESTIGDALASGRLEASPDPQHVIAAEIRIFRCARTLEPHIESVWDYLTHLSAVEGGEGTGGGRSATAGKPPRHGTNALSGRLPTYRLDGSAENPQNAGGKPPERRIRRR